MSRLALLFPLALLALALAVGPASAAVPKIVASDGPGFTIAARTTVGKLITTLKPGKYLLVVNDKSNIHNFHIKGPGLNKVVTTVPFVGTKSVLVTLKKGVYTYVCDPHLTTMHGKILVK
jgi:plastocyanin